MHFQQILSRRVHLDFLESLTIVIFHLLAFNHSKEVNFNLNSTEESAVLIKDGSPLGLSFEFFEFPSYVTGLSNTAQCLKNLESALGAPLAIRVGGTTQDRTTYDPMLSTAIINVDKNKNLVPSQITFGPQFIALAQRFKGPVTLGFNRRCNNLTNTLLAIQETVNWIPNLYSIELGNEPEFWGKAAPIAQNRRWDSDLDAKSQILWQQEIFKVIKKPELVQSGVFLKGGSWSIKTLAPKISAADNSGFIKSFGRHTYPQSACGHAKTNLSKLMSHTEIVKFTRRHISEVQAAQSLDKPFHFSETNSATCGGGGISSTFGASLWLIDYVLQSLRIGVQRLYFHQGTITNSPYSFWGKSQVFSPYYGAYFVARSLRGSDYFSILISSDPDQVAYAFYHQSQLLRVLILDSTFVNSTSTAAKLSPTRSQVAFNRALNQGSLSGLPSQSTQSSAKLLRLTAPGAEVEQTDKTGPTVGGARFGNQKCDLESPLKYEKVEIKSGSLSFQLAASEAILVEFSS